MDIDANIAQALGFPKQKYMAVERERRWLCRRIPFDRVEQTDDISDLYVTGTQLRLRDARPTDDRAPLRRLTRKSDVNAHTRLITSLYLSTEEFELLNSVLPGKRVLKRRYRLRCEQGLWLAVDEFRQDLAGLILAEAEFDTDEALRTFPSPDFVDREVTDDPRYTGGRLAVNGLPKET